MTNFKRGDIALVDFGYAAKVRPAIILSIPKADGQRNMSVVVPLTTEMRGGECEVPLVKPRWLAEECVANLIGLSGIDNAKIGRVLGSLPLEKLAEIDQGLIRMLGL